MKDACNSCGANASTAGLGICQYCPETLCLRCRVAHELICKEMQRRKKLGLGPTVRQIFLVLLAFLLTMGTARSQDRFMLGTSGGDSYSNLSAGVAGAAELPIRRHFEVDLLDNFQPWEYHTALGSGYANLARANGIIWLNPTVGLLGAVEYSGYSVTTVQKGQYYAYGGPVFRLYVFGVPSRLEFDYINEFKNGISDTGVETGHLQGFRLALTGRVGCEGAVCFRLSEEVDAGHNLTQGNPICDGSDGNGSQAGLLPCPRSSDFGGGATVTFSMEFPRHRGHENDLF